MLLSHVGQQLLQSARNGTLSVGALERAARNVAQVSREELLAVLLEASTLAPEVTLRALTDNGLIAQRIKNYAEVRRLRAKANHAIVHRKPIANRLTKEHQESEMLMSIEERIAIAKHLVLEENGKVCENEVRFVVATIKLIGNEEASWGLMLRLKLSISHAKSANFGSFVWRQFDIPPLVPKKTDAAA